MNLIICVGVAGSGKTTFANEYSAEIRSTAIISRDDTRISLCGVYTKRRYHEQYRNDELEKVVFDVNKSIALQIVKSKYHKNIIICDTNLNIHTFNYWVEFAKEHKLKLKIKLFEVDLCALYERNYNRDFHDKVPNYVIESMYNAMQDMTKIIKEKYRRKMI